MANLFIINETTFEGSSTKSNFLGVQHSKAMFGDEAQIIEEKDKYSYNDLLVKKGSCYYLVEIKIRNKVYNNFILEYKKKENLKKKVREYENKGIFITDIYYLCIVENTGYWFSFNKLKRMITVSLPRVINFRDTTKFFSSINNQGAMLYGESYNKYQTASDGNNERVKKYCYYIHTSVAQITKI